MATSLIVELDARTTKLDAGLKKTEGNLDAFETKVKSNDVSLKGFTSVAGTAASGVVAVGQAAIAAATALSTMIVMTAKSQQELGILSKQAKLSTADFEALSFATAQYGVSAEQIADISKDISDKIGEYSKAGTGAFQDFADVVGLTTEEAVKAATEFGTMSSDQVLGKMVSMMEESGATADQMTFALESMGNDASRLTDLFINQSSELTTLTTRYNAATKSMNLTRGETEDLQQTATDFNLAMDTMGKAGAQISASLAPALSEFFNGVITVVPDATQTIINFINSFRSADSIQSVEALNEQILESQINISEMRQSMTAASQVTSYWGVGQGTTTTKTKELNAAIKEEEERISELLAQKEKLEAQEIADADRLKGGKITATGGTGLISSASGADDTATQLAAIEDRFKSEQTLLTEKLNEDLAIIGENNELKLQLEQEYLENLLALDEKYDQEMLDNQEALAKANAKISDANIDSVENETDNKTQAQQDYLSAANTIGNALFEDNKAVNAGLAVANTAAGVTKALSTQNWAAAAATAVAGAAQLATIMSSSVGGSSTVTSVSSTASDSTDTDSARISSTDASGNTQNVVISFDASDSDIIAAIAKGLKTESTTGNI